MKFFVITFICVFRVLLFVQSEQLYTKFQQAFCKLQCLEENISASSSCSNASDCKCNRALLPNLDSISMTAYGKGKLKVKCKSYDMVFLEWNDDFNPFNRNNTNVYFLHVTTVNNVFFTDVISCHYHSIKGLKPNTSYTISLWGVDNAHNIFVSKSVNVRTNEERTPLPVTNISLNLKPEAKYYEGDLQWTPAKDLSCFYEIMVFRMDFSFTNVDNIPPPQIYDIIPTPELFTIHIEKLEFGYPYDVLIKSRGSKSGRTSDNRRYTFGIPSCLAAHKNLTLCAPAKPKNFTVMEIPSSALDETETNLFDIQLAWSRPSLIPDYYIAELLVYNSTNHVTTNANMTIPGEKNDAIFGEIIINASYQVDLQAISSGGKSPRAIINRFLIPPDGFVPNLLDEKNKSETSRHSEVGKIMKIFIGMIITLLMFIISSTLVIYTRRRKHYSEKIKNNEKEILEKQFSKSIFHQIGETDKWEIPFEKLSYQSHLGEGHFGVVCCATLGGKPVACKILKDNSTIDETRQLLQEIELMKNVGSHPNIVSMIGCVTQNVTNGPILVVEYCSMGNLLTYLRSVYDHTSKMLNEYHEDVYHDGRQLFINKSYELNFSQNESSLSLSHKDVLSFGSQIAFGMEYLSQQKILHRDLAARNILMCEDKRLKLSDFGLSRDVYMNSVYYRKSGGKLPLRWMALESLTHQIYSTQSDVWSFGVVLWEIVSFGGLPYPGVEAQDLSKLLKEGFRMAKPQFCHDKVYSIMRDCWKESPNDRPTFSALKETFDALLATESDYLELATTT